MYRPTQTNRKHCDYNKTVDPVYGNNTGEQGAVAIIHHYNLSNKDCIEWLINLLRLV